MLAIGLTHSDTVDPALASHRRDDERPSDQSERAVGFDVASDQLPEVVSCGVLGAGEASATRRSRVRQTNPAVRTEYTLLTAAAPR